MQKHFRVDMRSTSIVFHELVRNSSLSMLPDRPLSKNSNKSVQSTVDRLGTRVFKKRCICQRSKASVPKCRIIECGAETAERMGPLAKGPSEASGILDHKMLLAIRRDLFSHSLSQFGILKLR